MEEARVLDRRVRRTRSRLEEGLLSLLGEKALERITMREVCRRADVATATPYAHYRDVVDILEQMEVRLESRLEGILRAYPAKAGITAPMLAELMSLSREEAGLCKALLCKEADPIFTARSLARLEGDLALRLAAQPEAGLRAAFGMGGCLAVLRQWLLQGCVEQPEEMARLLLPLMA